MKYEGEILKKLTGNTFNIKVLHIFRKDSTRKIFTVYLTVPDEEQQTRKEKYSLECRADEKEKAKEKSFELAKNWINDLTDNTDEFKENTAYRVTAILRILLDKNNGCFSFDESTASKFNQVIDDINKTIINGSVQFSHSIYEQKLINYARDAFDRHVAGFFTESDKNREFQHFVDELNRMPDVKVKYPKYGVATH